MSSGRGHIGLKTQLASALLTLGDVPYDHAKLMSAHQFASLYRWDHSIYHTHGGTDDFWNLTPRLIAADRKKTAEQDLPAIAHVRRIIKKADRHLSRMNAKQTGEPVREKPRKRIAQRPNPWPAKGSQKLRGRGIK